MEAESELVYQPMNSTIQKQNDTCGTVLSEAPITSPPRLSTTHILGPNKSTTVCNVCFATVKTSIKHTVTTRTHVASALCCFVSCCWSGCFGYCMDSCRNTDHYCPNCNTYLGTYEK